MSVRISATDLRDATRKTAAIKAEALACGVPTPEVLLDVRVLIEHSAAAAFAALDSEPAQDTSRVRYVGTARGLSEYISDVQRLGIADGVVLLTSDRDHVTSLMLDELAPGLASA